MSGGFFRGTSADQDTRFSNKQAKLLKTQKFASELEHLVDITKVKMDVMKPWIANRVTELLGFEDEVLINFIYGLLDGKVVNGKEVQIQLTGFMEKNTGKFMKELWTLLLSAQNNASGVPQQFLDAKEEETRKKKAEADRIANEIQRKKEKESRERNQQSLKKTAGAVEKKGNSATWEPNSNTNVAGALSSRLEDEKEGGERNGVRGRNRLSGSPQSVVHSPSSQRVSPSRSISKSYSNSRSYSNDRCKSRSLSRSLEARRPSISSDRVCRTSKRRSITPRSRHSPWTSRSPSRRRLSYYRRRSRSHSPRRSPSPLRRRLHSPFHRRSPLSPPGRSPSPVRHRRSPSLVRRRRSPSPIYRRRSPSPARRRRSPSPARRRRSPLPIRRRRSPSPIRRRRSPSPIRRRRSPSPIRRRRSPSPIQDRRSPSPIRRRRSPSPILHRRSPSPLRRRSPSPVQRQAVSLVNCMSPAPGCRKTPSPVQRAHRRSTSTSEHRSSSSMRYRSPMPQRRRSPTALKLRSPSYRSSSPSPTRRRSPSPDVKRRRSPVHSARVSSRSGEIFSPAARQPSSSFRAAQGDPGDQRETRAKAPPLSPSAERSPSVESPPHATRKRRSAGDQRSESPYESPVRQPKNLSVRGGSISPRPMSRGRKQHQDGLKTSKVNIESNHASERFSERAISGSSNQLTSPPLYKDARRGEKQLLSCHGERKESDERDHSRSDNGKESSEFCKPESATKVVEKDDLNSRSEASDSESGGQNRHRSEVKEKRRHKRYRKEEVASDDVNSSDSEIERKHSKKRRKEEKRLRKEDKRRRREERRRRREERRAEKRKLKNNNADTSDCDDLHRRKSHAKEDEETEQRRLEIELRKKALESIKAKKNSNR